MTNSVGGIAGLTQSAPQQSAPAGAVVSGTAPGAPSPGLQPLAQDPDTPISPRIVVDPLAGVITEFLNTTGQVQSQIPSAAVVAYLRVGLDASGQAKPQPGEDTKPKQGDSVVA
jgi:hypothetical protein